MKRTIHLSYWKKSLAGLLLTVLFSGQAVYAGGVKVNVCHYAKKGDKLVPITINQAAWETHKKHHGDYMGDCVAGAAPIPDPNAATSFKGIGFTVCDNRQGETGRQINVSKHGNIKDAKTLCD